jgi:serine protease Do
MSNSINRWIAIPIILILTIFTVINGVLVLKQSSQIEDIQIEMASLEIQLQDASDKVSSLESLMPELADLAENISALAEDVSAIELSTQDLPAQSQIEPVIADVVAAVKPSVVAIDTEYSYYFWGRTYTEEGSGSGWIIDESGIIVTNYHVVEGADTISVTLDDGRTFEVDPDTVVADAVDDLAVLKIDASNLTAAKVGDSSALRVGDWVVAIGNSLGLGISAKEGIVSRLDVSLTVEHQLVESLVETSAAINAGNSGGPLVNMNGEVIGITSIKIASVGVEGLGYAISINEAILILNQLIAQIQ